MSTVLAPWPVCPPPHEGESLHSWFERVAAFYGLTAHRMLSSLRTKLELRRSLMFDRLGFTFAHRRRWLMER